MRFCNKLRWHGHNNISNQAIGKLQKALSIHLLYVQENRLSFHNRYNLLVGSFFMIKLNRFAICLEKMITDRTKNCRKHWFLECVTRVSHVPKAIKASHVMWTVSDFLTHTRQIEPEELRSYIIAGSANPSTNWILISHNPEVVRLISWPWNRTPEKVATPRKKM
jgi:hypothetical protein